MEEENTAGKGVQRKENVGKILAMILKRNNFYKLSFLQPSCAIDR